ncbi:EF-Tu/IF-2/RF-3 family GTPase [Kitasatospora sp. NPDC057500]|uniref:EF-Tu C-terminal domain-related protein n=1 Tax=Kitasatospora sp. NPDC057500 TaxID=3346151 RepID=UPI0036B4D690
MAATETAGQLADADGPFLFAFEDAFNVPGRGVAVTGTIDRGTVTTGSGIELVGVDGTRTVTCVGIEQRNKALEQARAGEAVGLLLTGVTTDQLARGQVLAAPGSIKAHAAFEADVELLATEAGGLKDPVAGGSWPRFHVHTGEFSGTLELPAGTDALKPGDTARVTVTLEVAVAVEEGTGFWLRQGGRTVGAGAVTRIVE